MARTSGYWCLLCNPHRAVWVKAKDSKAAWHDHYLTEHAEKRTA